VTNKPFQLCHFVEPIRKVLANLVPVTHSPLNTTDAVVVGVPKVIHRWQLQAQPGQMRVAILFGDTVVNQKKVLIDIVVAVNEFVSAILFFSGVAKYLNVARSLVLLAHVLLQNHGARCAKLILDEPTLCEHVVDGPLVLFIPDDFDRDASHTSKVIKEPKVIWVFFFHPAINSLNVAIFDGSKDCGNRTGGTAGEP
jgi:hypothetical protein